ncbi:unnamed protein product [Mytilus coruscus]|uniref:Uncharacterized protein n=1 Tax=Mytilus coruscus TaxID=42192 RepID=A0A6J8BQB7_MYTCO|nr:unnamed protein product [Mytilus coruscus]
MKKVVNIGNAHCIPKNSNNSKSRNRYSYACNYKFYKTRMCYLIGLLFVILVPSMAISSWNSVTAPSLYYDETAYWKNECAKCFNNMQQITSENKDLYRQIHKLEFILGQEQIETERLKNVTADFDAKLLSRISTSIKEQNSLWLKCIAVTPGRPCDITQGCSTSKQGQCFPINV